MIEPFSQAGFSSDHTLHAEALGRHLQHLRQLRGWSLSRLANDAGVAKSNLSRLEQGNGNPTLDTLWRLASCLDVPFGTLIKPVTTALDDQGVQVQLIDQGDSQPAVDVYWMRLDPDVYRLSAAHPAGVHETVTVISGRLTTGPEYQSHTLGPGQSITFAADRPHLYASNHQATSATVTIVYHPPETSR